MREPLFHLHEHEGPVLLNFPHSGRYLPDEVAVQLNERGKAQADTDWHVPELYAFAKGRVSWLQATHSRYVVDLNRDPSGINLYPGQATTGLCPDTDFAGASIYAVQSPDEQDIKHRQQIYFLKYHSELQQQIRRIYGIHGYCVLLDCHSILSHVPRLFDGALSDLNLGTNTGQSCADELEKVAEHTLKCKDFSYVRNGRFKGGWITRHYGRPAKNAHALQLEIAQSAYMDETIPHAFDADRAAPLMAVLQDLVHALLEWGPNKDQNDE